MKLLKYLLIIYFLFSISIKTKAQKDIERRVYYLDITASMEGYHGAENIWEDVKQGLKNAIKNIPDTTTEILVLTFTDSNHPVTLVGNNIYKANQSDILHLWTEIDKLKTITDCHTDVYIPFQDFYGKRISKGRVNCFFLMTDGKQLDKGNSILQGEIERWKSVSNYGNEYVYGWYLMLTDAAQVSNINNWIGDSVTQDRDHLWAVKSADVNLNLVRFKKDFADSVDVRKDSLIIIPFKYCPDGIKFKVYIEGSNDNYDIGQPKVSTDKRQLLLKVTPKKEKKLSGIQPYSILNLKFELINKPNKYTWLMTDKVKIVCINNLSPSLTNIHVKELTDKSRCLGVQNRYPSLFSLSEDTIGITRTFSFSFDDDAIAKGTTCRARFRFVDNNGDSIPFLKMNVLMEDSKIWKTCSMFEVTPNDSIKKFRFCFTSNADGGIYHIRLKLISVDSLKSVKNCPLDSFVYNPIVDTYIIKYNKNCNPAWWWLLFLILLLLTIVAAIIAIFIAHRLLSPKFPKYAQISFDSGLDNNIGVDLCMYKNKLLSSAGKGAQASVFLTHLLSAYHIKEVIITSQTVNANNPEKFRFLSRKWISQQWNGDIIYINGVFNNYPIKHITITPRGRFQSYADVTIEFTREIIDNNRRVAIKEEKLCFFKLLERDNPHPVSIVVLGNVLMLGERSSIVN